MHYHYNFHSTIYVLVFVASALIGGVSEWVGYTATYFTDYQHTGHDLLYPPAESEIDAECTCR